MKKIIDRAAMEKNLPKKGFERKGSHHTYYHHMYNGKETGAYTYISHGSKLKEYSGALLTPIRRQLKLNTNQEAVDLAMCSMDGDAYNDLLTANGVFDPDNL